MKTSLLLALGFLFFFANRASACGTSCTQTACQHWGVFTLSDSCAEEIGFLDPSNWTEDNIIYLMNEYIGPLRSGYITRAELYTQSDESNSADTLSLASDFAKGVQLFNDEKYPEAAAEFATLSKDPNHRAQALYLEARSHLRHSQLEFDGYITANDLTRGNKEASELTGINKEDLKKARTLFETFVKEFPDHAWAKSARHLLGRRINLLEGKSQAYTSFIRAELDRMLTRKRENADANEEAETYALLSEYDQFGNYFVEKDLHPLLWILRVYYVSRSYPEKGFWSEHSAEKELNLLRQNKSVFKKYPELFSLAEAQLLLKSGQFKEGLKAFPEKILVKDKRLTNSWVVLRGNLLLGDGRADEARKYLRDHYDFERAKESGHRWVTFSYFWEKAPHKLWKKEAQGYFKWLNPEVLQSLTGQFPDLKLIIKEISTKGFPQEMPEAVQGALARGLFIRTALELDGDSFLAVWKKKKLEDWEAVEKNFQVLMKNPQNQRAQFEITSYLNAQNHHVHEGARCENYQADESKIKYPIVRYKEMIDDLERAGDTLLLPEVLSAAIGCYKRTSFNTCLNPDDQTPAEARKQWFSTLKKKFPKSTAAQETKYWY